MKEYQDPANILDQKKEVQRLLESPGWGMIVAMVQEQVDALQQEILFGAVCCAEDLYRLERKKGMLEGRLSLQATANQLVEQLDIDIERARRKEKSNADE